MKLAASLLLVASAWAQAPLKTALLSSTDRPNVMRAVVSDLEKRIDNKISTTGGSDPVYLLGVTRGLYLAGYGAVFTVEADLVDTPRPNPFRQKITAEEATKVHQRKLEHVAMLKKAMHEIWVDTASTLTALPENEQVVVAVRLLYQPWEDTKGLPGQIVMKGSRKAALTGDIQTEEQ